MMSVQASSQDQHENQQPLQRSNANTNTKMKPTGAKHCRYFNTRVGCKNEDTCPFLHIPSDKTVTNKNKSVNRAGEFDCNGEERVTGNHNHIGNTRPGTTSNRRSKEIHPRVKVRRNEKEHYPSPTEGEESQPQSQSQSQPSLNPNANDSTASGDDKDASITANGNRNRNRNKNMDCDTNSSADTTTSKRKSQSKKSRNRTKKKGESTRNPDRLTKAQATSALREMISKAQPQHCNENPNQDKNDNNAMCNSNMDANSNGIGNSIGNGNGNSARGKKSDPKKIRCKYGSKCRANKCKFLHPLDTTNAASSACVKVEQKMNTNSSASHGVSNIDAVQEATSPHTRTRKARRKEKARPATSAGTGPRSNLNADQTSKKSKSHTRKRPQSQPQAQPQPQFTDSNIDQLLFGEGSNELWDNMDIPSLPLPTATAVGSASENGTTRENKNGKNNGRGDDRSSSQSIGTDTGSRSNSNSRSGAGTGTVTGTNRSSQNMSSKKIAQRLRKEMQIAERLQQEEKKRIRRMQGQKPISISINVDVNGSENANGNGNNAIKSQKMMQKVGDNWNGRELVQTRLEEKAKNEAEREKMDAMRKAQGAVAAKKKLDQQKKAAAALAKSIAKAKAEAEKEKARIAANVRARDKEEMKARAIAKAKADRETEELKRITARAKVKADEGAKAKALAQAEAEARAMALAEAKASATKAKREEKEKERAKAREIARCKREQEMEARRIEDEMRAEKFAREQAEKANLVVEQKAARAKKLREEKEAARLKKLKNEEKRSNKAMQMKDERLRFWETDRNQRIEFMCVMRQFCFAEAMRIGGINDHSELDSDVLRSIEDEGSKAYATLYPNLAISKVKVITTKNKQLHNRNGTILAWDTSKKKYKIGLDTKKQKVEIVYISAENLEEAESSSSARANKSTTGNVTGSVDAFVKTPLGDLVSSRTFIDRLRLTYRLDPTSLKDSIDKEMKARNEADRVARIRKEKEMKEFLEQQRIDDEQFRKEREKRRARQAAEEREHYERARQKEEARERARRAQRANNRGRGGHFYGGGFGGDFFGSGRGGPNIGFGIGPDGRPFIFLDGEGFDYDDDDSYGWEEEEDGAPMEEHAETLGVPVDASIKEIKTAYRKMALKFHPDKYQAEKAEGMTKDEAEEHFKKCSAAQQHLLEANGD